jgi:hypothetical protein
MSADPETFVPAPLAAESDAAHHAIVAAKAEVERITAAEGNRLLAALLTLPEYAKAEEVWVTARYRHDIVSEEVTKQNDRYYSEASDIKAKFTALVEDAERRLRNAKGKARRVRDIEAKAAAEAEAEAIKAEIETASIEHSRVMRELRQATDTLLADRLRSAYHNTFAHDRGQAEQAAERLMWKSLGLERVRYGAISDAVWRSARERTDALVKAMREQRPVEPAVLVAEAEAQRAKAKAVKAAAEAAEAVRAAEAAAAKSATATAEAEAAKAAAESAAESAH